MADQQNQRRALGTPGEERALGSIAEGVSGHGSVNPEPASPSKFGDIAIARIHPCLESSVPAIMLWLLRVPIPIIVLFALLY